MERGCAKKDCQAHNLNTEDAMDREARNLNKEDAMDHGRWKKLIKIG